MYGRLRFRKCELDFMDLKDNDCHSWETRVHRCRVTTAFTSYCARKSSTGSMNVSGLPPEFGLMEQYRVARVTVRRALAELQGRADLSAAGAGDLRHAAGGIKSLGGARLEAVLGDA